MVNIGKLEARITLDTKGFQKGITRIQRDTNKATTSIERSFKRIETLLAGTAIVAGLEKIFDFGEAGESLQALEASFAQFADTLNFDATEAIEAFRDATQNLVTDADLLANANSAILLGLVENQQQFEDLAAAAITLGQAVGQDAVQSLENLVNGLGRGSTEVLDNLGIVLRAEEAYEIFAKRLGKTSNALTETERTQAKQVVGLERAIEKADELSGAQEKVGSSFRTTSVAISNFIDRLGLAISKNTEFGESVSGVGAAINSLSEEDIGNLVTAIERVGVALTGVGLLAIAARFEVLRNAVTKILKPLTQFAAGLRIIGAGIASIFAPFLLFTKASKANAAALKAGSLALLSTAKNAQRFGDTSIKTALTVTSLTSQVRALGGTGTLLDKLAFSFGNLKNVTVAFGRSLIAVPLKLARGAFNLLRIALVKIAIPLAIGAAAFGALEGIFRPLIGTIGRLTGKNITFTSTLGGLADALNFITNLISGTVSLALNTLARGFQTVINVAAKAFAVFGGDEIAESLRSFSKNIDIFVEETNKSAAESFNELGGDLGGALREGIGQGFNEGGEKFNTEIEASLDSVAEKAKETSEATANIIDPEKAQENLNQLVTRVSSSFNEIQVIVDDISGPIIPSLVTDEGTIIQLKELTRRFTILKDEGAFTNVVLERQARSLNVLGTNSSETRGKIERLVKALSGTAEESKKARQELIELVNELRVTAGLAPLAGREIEQFGASAEIAGTGLGRLQDELKQTQIDLRDVAREADSAGNALVGAATAGGIGAERGRQRSTTSLGAVVGGAGGSVDIQRALTSITAQLASASSGQRGGFANLQIQALSAQRGSLQEQLNIALQSERDAIVDTIVNTFIGQGLTGASLTQAVQDALATRDRFGLSGGTTSTNAQAGFGTFQAGGTF